MAKRILFRPSEYRELSPAEQDFLTTAYQKAIDALRRNLTPMGFSACSLADNASYGTDENYRSVWARDSAKTIIWSLDLADDDIRQCAANSFRTLLRHQSPTGQIPANVRIETDEPEYSGVGGIASIDSVLWIIIALWRYSYEADDWTIIEEFRGHLQRAMDWLSAHDSNNCGMLEIPEAGDWTDLFDRSYHVLYDEILWYRCLLCYSNILRHFDDHERGDDYEKWARHVGDVILANFWPSTSDERAGHANHKFAQTQFSLGDSRYLVAQISPFSFSWRCDVYANLLAYMMNLIDKDRAMMTFRFMWGVGVNEPGLVKNLYPPVQAGDPEWRDYFTVNLMNLPNHYHNGGIWPFIGSIWVRYIHKLGFTDLASRELLKLAEMCSKGVSQEWEFNEWHHGVTGRPMGKAFQAWSAAGFLQACHDLHVDAESIGHEE